jgi:hypothetical protein
MDETHPGAMERKRCAERTYAALIEYAPKRPLADREALRLGWQKDRCGVCGACPRIIAALGLMMPAASEATAVILRLAG